MKLRWLGHAAFRIETAKDTILIDPFLTHNPAFQGQDVKDVTKGVTHILLTHGHMDHVGDTIGLANELGAVVVANADLGDWLGFRGVKKVEQGNTGGTIHTGSFSVTFTNALHSAAHVTEDGVSHALGNANGLMLHFDDEPSLLHMGDTDIFADMALTQELHQPDIGLVPIGDRFTMGGAVAALACRRYFDFRAVIPCHYKTFGLLDQTADKFVAGMEGAKARVEVPDVGAVVSL
jgi:L-ascorbate metabolism protein UlaG (beta-lactamase superfamily)